MKVHDWMQGVANGERTSILCKSEVDGFMVATTDTPDEGYETAILDVNGVHPVERYKRCSEAMEGHQRWVEFALTGSGKTVTQLFWSDMPEFNKRVVLVAWKE